MTGLIVDTNDLYYNLKRKHGDNFRLNYAAYVKYIGEMYPLDFMEAYGLNFRRSGKRFIESLEAIGFDVELLDVMNVTPTTKAMGIVPIVLSMTSFNAGDKLILGSSSPVLLPVIDHCIDKGVNVVMVASSFPQEMTVQYNTLEIPRFLGEVTC